MSRSALQDLAKKRQDFAECALFFASSAGEYEQALPLISRLERENPKLMVVLIFFSESGMNFARTQKESRPFLKAPWDDIFAWTKIFKALDPKVSFVIRYELWPAFLSLAHRWGRVYLIDAPPPSSTEGHVSIIFKRYLLKKMTAIFLVSQESKAVYRDRYRIGAQQLHWSGDTKYDRSVERVQQRLPQLEQLSQSLSKAWPRKKRLILGSAWQKDLSVFLEAYGPRFRDTWQIILAPHDVSEPMMQWFEAQLKEAQLSFCRLSSLPKLGSQHQCLLVDRIGLLPELYGCADVAFVGGAMHYRVHNVLEPAVRGLYLCFGPLYQTSQEAVLLVQRGLGKVVKNSEDLANWWDDLKVEPGVGFQDLMRTIDQMCGASDRILQLIKDDPLRT